MILNLPAEFGCVALINIKRYMSFGPDYGWYSLIDQANASNIIVWGLGRGNWNIELSLSSIQRRGSRKTVGSIVSDGELYFVNNDWLDSIDRDRNQKLPIPDTEEYLVKVPEGRYVCTVIQLFNPNMSKWIEPWTRGKIHYQLAMHKSDEPVPEISEIPWCPYDAV